MEAEAVGFVLEIESLDAEPLGEAFEAAQRCRFVSRYRSVERSDGLHLLPPEVRHVGNWLPEIRRLLVETPEYLFVRILQRL